VVRVRCRRCAALAALSLEAKRISMPSIPWPHVHAQQPQLATLDLGRSAHSHATGVARFRRHTHPPPPTQNRHASTPDEALFFYQEHYVDRVYLRNGVRGRGVSWC